MTDDLTMDLMKELKEANSEIARHHELITRLRDYLNWALDHIQMCWDEDVKRYDEIRTFLNREVG